jgi:hypothetical protein
VGARTRYPLSLTVIGDETWTRAATTCLHFSINQTWRSMTSLGQIITLSIYGAYTSTHPSEFGSGAETERNRGYYLKTRWFLTLYDTMECKPVRHPLVYQYLFEFFLTPALFYSIVPSIYRSAI